MDIELENPCNEINLGVDVISKDISKIFPPDSDIGQIMYAPYLSQVKKWNNKILMCSLETFKRRFGIDSDILDPIIELWKRGYKCTVAGGKMIDFFLNKKLAESTNDYDIFSVDEKQRYSLEQGFRELGLENSVLLGHLHEMTSTGTCEWNPLKVQIVGTLYANQENIIETFDIRACAIACDGEYVYWIKGALKDIKQKKITMLEPRVAITTFFRIHKYIKKGYEISIPDLAIASVNFLDAVAKYPNKRLLFEREYAIERNHDINDYNVAEI